MTAAITGHTGRLTAAPEGKTLPSGVIVATFSVASNERIRDKGTGEWKDGDPLFLNCVAYDVLAEQIIETLDKGQAVILNGKLKQRSYEKDGQKRTVYEVRLDSIGPDLRWAKPKSQASGGYSEPPPFL